MKKTVRPRVLLLLVVIGLATLLLALFGYGIPLLVLEELFSLFLVFQSHSEESLFHLIGSVGTALKREQQLYARALTRSGTPCPACNHQLVLGASFCDFCGKPTIAEGEGKPCLSCHTKIPLEAIYCPCCCYQVAFARKGRLPQSSDDYWLNDFPVTAKQQRW